MDAHLRNLNLTLCSSTCLYICVTSRMDMNKYDSLEQISLATIASLAAKLSCGEALGSRGALSSSC
jgi:hypothetical protein